MRATGELRFERTWDSRGKRRVETIGIDELRKILRDRCKANDEEVGEIVRRIIGCELGSDVITAAGSFRLKARLAELPKEGDRC